MGKPNRRRAHAKAPTERAILMRWAEMVEPGVGEPHYVLVPAFPIDRRLLRERGFRRDSVMVVDVFEDRNLKFWRKFHALAMFLIDNVPEFEGMRDAHAAVKDLQLRAGAHCDRVQYEMEDGTPIYRTEPRSLSFKETDEGTATMVWESMVEYLCRNLMPGWDAAKVAEACTFWERQS